MVKNSRRDVLLGAGALVALGAVAARAATPVLTDDGYYRETWFIESFLELADDHAAARAKGKHFAVMWELKGCPYCRETHFVNFARPDISEFVQANFDILPLNVLGSRKVTDVDGEELPEKQLAAKYGVKFTPTIQFFPDQPRRHQGSSAREARSDPHSGLSAAGRFPRRVPVRRSSATPALKTFREFLKSRSS